MPDLTNLELLLMEEGLILKFKQRKFLIFDRSDIIAYMMKIQIDDTKKCTIKIFRFEVKFVKLVKIILPFTNLNILQNGIFLVFFVL